MPAEITEEQMGEIMDLIFSGQKIAAVKQYREIANPEPDGVKSLLEAKKFIEQLTQELREKYPERFMRPKPSGCSSAALLFVAIAGGGAWYLSKWMS